jgi:ABC-type multidrug transport system permease subunit
MEEVRGTGSFTKYLSLDRNTIFLIYKHALKNLATSPGMYVTLTLILGISLIALRSTLKMINEGYMTVLFQPFVLPLMAAVVLAGVFVAVASGFSVARERELGMLETLFYGPIRFGEYLLGKLLAHLTAYALMLISFLGINILLASLTHLTLSLALILISGLSVATTASLVGLGLLFASAIGTARGTILLFIGLITILLVLQASQAILTNAVYSNNIAGLIVVRDTVAVINKAVAYFSPVSYLSEGADAVLRQDWLVCTRYFIEALVYAIGALYLATITLRRKGVTR